MRVYETPDLYVDYFGEPAVFRVTRRYQFAASHRLHAPQLSEEENRRLYGKCNNPYGHGHNYVVEVSARGPLDERTGRAVDTAPPGRAGGAAGAGAVRSPQSERGSGGVRAAWCRLRRTWRWRSAAG